MRLLFLLIVLNSAVSFSQELPLYYGSDFLQSYQSNSLHDEELKSTLFDVLKGGHVKKTNQPDELVPSCEGYSSCVQHRALGYDGARKKLFGELYLKEVGGVYTVKDVYCEREYTDDDFSAKPSIGPNLIPTSGSILNTEHTWPQSKFSSRFPKEMQKSDLHHLFPTDSEMNNHRANLHFGEVVSMKSEQKCPQNKLGDNAEGDLVFEVPNSQKGNTARAIFYFATRYQMKVDSTEEATLRKWHTQDPVDAEEYSQNVLIDKLQGNRNPFIDFPDLVDRINHF